MQMNEARYHDDAGEMCLFAPAAEELFICAKSHILAAGDMFICQREACLFQVRRPGCAQRYVTINRWKCGFETLNIRA